MGPRLHLMWAAELGYMLSFPGPISLEGIKGHGEQLRLGTVAGKYRLLVNMATSAEVGTSGLKGSGRETAGQGMAGSTREPRRG